MFSLEFYPKANNCYPWEIEILKTFLTYGAVSLCESTLFSINRIFPL